MFRPDKRRQMKTRALTVLALLAFCSLPMASGQATLTFTQVGTDATDDDTEAVGSVEEPSGIVGSNVVPAPGNDQANIDDVVGLSIAATASDVVFRVEVAEKPADASRLLGTFCWVAAFQVGSSADEYLALGCTEYDAQGSGTDKLDAQSTRGPNVIKSMAWDGDTAAVLLTVSRSDIKAGVGAVLTDIYALTYMGSSLSVDDPAPDAKSDRDASDSFGSYVLDSGEASPAGSNPMSTIRHVYREATGSTFNVTLDFLPKEWVMYHYNWTNPSDEVRFNCQVSDLAPVWTWTTQIQASHEGGRGVSSILKESDCNDHAQPAGRNTGFKGPLTISISLRAGNGTFNAQIVPASSSATSTSGGPVSTSGQGPGTGTSQTGGGGGGTSNKSPVLPFGVLVSLLACAALVASRRKKIASC